MKIIINYLIILMASCVVIELRAQDIYHHVGIRLFNKQYTYLNGDYQKGKVKMWNKLAGLSYYASFNKYKVGIEALEYYFNMDNSQGLYESGLLYGIGGRTYSPFVGYNFIEGKKNKLGLLVGWMVYRPTSSINVAILNKAFDPIEGRFSSEKFLAKGSLLLGIEGSRVMYKNFTIDARLSYTHQMIPLKFVNREWQFPQPQVNFDPKINFINFQIALGYNFGHNKP